MHLSGSLRLTYKKVELLMASVKPPTPMGTLEVLSTPIMQAVKSSIFPKQA